MEHSLVKDTNCVVFAITFNDYEIMMWGLLIHWILDIVYLLFSLGRGIST
jgi:hypothetical protein